MNKLNYQTQSVYLMCTAIYKRKHEKAKKDFISHKIIKSDAIVYLVE